MNKEKILMVTGGILSTLLIAGLIILYRFYKHVGRRCDCGEMGETYRESKIRLAKGDTFHPSIPKKQVAELFRHFGPTAWKKFRKEFRWWIRDALLITFSICPNHIEVDGKSEALVARRLIKVVTVSNRPISLWHLCWVWYFDRKQFVDDAQFNSVFSRFTHDLWNDRKVNSIIEKPENPPYKLSL
jgi:hypothetical protein